MNFLRGVIKLKLSVINICITELRKMGKRKDFLSLLGILAIGILFSASILTDGYTGAKQQSALYWVVTQLLNSSVLLIAPMILSYSSIRTMAQEIENGSIKLFDSRIQNRQHLYFGKSIAVWIYSTFFFAASIVIHSMIYFFIVCNNKEVASGKMYGKNTAILLCTLFAVYLSAFCLVPQIVLFFGTFAKQGICIGGMFVLILIAHNIYKIPVIGMISPWNYIIRLANDVMNTTKLVPMEKIFMIKNVLAEISLCGIGCLLCVSFGSKILGKRDL